MRSPLTSISCRFCCVCCRTSQKSNSEASDMGVAGAAGLLSVDASCCCGSGSAASLLAALGSALRAPGPDLGTCSCASSACDFPLEPRSCCSAVVRRFEVELLRALLCVLFKELDKLPGCEPLIRRGVALGAPPGSQGPGDPAPLRFSLLAGLVSCLTRSSSAPALHLALLVRGVVILFYCD